MNECGVNCPEILDVSRLIDGVIEKHNKFLSEYEQEFKELDEKVKSLDEKIAAAKSKKEFVIERSEILKEKRQQIYYQAEQLLKDTLSDTPDLDKKLKSEIYTNFKKSRNSKKIEDEQRAVDILFGNIEKLPSNDQNISSPITSIKKKVQESIEATKEFSSIDGTEFSIEKDIAIMAEERDKILPRHKWLDKRIESHREALSYWKTQNNNYETNLVV
ncbi:conserved hypothetical protein [Methanosalsum zhilinae DSM 4017]|uniref:Phosphoserine phosphatase n=1 Tax=Methanosalsum zhilinae (strain DSM 4017 / NBRC 107636 / OCM 62 / WeN5) TaxID=679901 RepID=F7XQF7_METZD|nr:hypothetical protein [Methanosalsum zhilinae]AEH60458.1 conserved hypothetical protein [Methanosalsum zhilinae DSM 4017]